MKLYHGSNVEVREPRLLKVQRELDFGKGFYTTSDLKQATTWARRTAARLREKESFVSVYDIDEPQMKKRKMLVFERPDEKWLHFITANRKGEGVLGEWDIICGPVANDQTMPVLDLYLNGMYDETEAIKRLLPQKLKDQYVFNSEKALSLLDCNEVIRV